jgi:hypothetical protein
MFILLKTSDSREILLIKRTVLMLVQVVYISVVATRATSRKVASSIPDRVIFQ